MDQETFEALTGLELDDSQSARYETMLAKATAELEKILGYPLDPTSWENLYNETGKTQDECPCPDVDTDSLEAPDAVVGSYRLYDWHAHDRYLAIDPLTEIYAVKLVKDNVTFKTYEPSEYRVDWQNGNPRVAFYLELCEKNVWCGCIRTCHCVQVAIDAEWAFTELPMDLQSALAELMLQGYDTRSDIKSESRSTHSYTKFERQTVLEKYPSLKNYFGPNSIFKQKGSVG